MMMILMMMMLWMCSERSYLIVRFNMFSKAQVLKRVFMTTEYLGVRRQWCQDVDHSMGHLLCSPLEEPATTQTIQSQVF